ncbi:MAG: FHA domain-containing protein [Vulcanimicrobiota bacterium]
MESWESGLQLRVVKGNQQGLVVPLRDRNYVLGRAISHEDVRPGRIFFHDPSVALVQAVLRWDEKTAVYVICHETGQSKSWVSGLPLARGTPRAVKSGSRLKLGKLVAVLEPLQAPEPSLRQNSSQEPEPSLATWTPPVVPPVVEPEPVSAQPVVARPEPSHNGVDPGLVPQQACKEAREGDRLEGPVAEFFPDGQLKQLGTYSRGKLSSTHNHLLLEHGKQVGRVKSDFNECSYSEGVEAVTTMLDDDIDYFEEETSWEVWVGKWIDQICSGQTVTVIL